MIQKIKNWSFQLLKKSEKYTKTDMVYLAKGEFWLIGGQILSSASTFFLAVSFANLLPKETYGTYKYILSIFGILTISTLRGLESPLSQSIAKNYEGDFLIILKEKIKYGFFGALASFILGVYYYVNGNNILSVCFFIVSVFVPFFEPLGIYHNYLLAKKKFRQSTIYKSSSQILTTLLMIVALFVIPNIFTVILVYFFSWSVLRIYFLIKTIKKFPPNKKKEPQAISYGRHSTAINVLASFIGSIDALLLFHYFGAAELAIYSFALSPVNQFSSLFDKLPTLALPKLAVRTIYEIKQIFWRRVIFLSIIGAVISLVYIFLSPILFKIFFPEYLDSIFYSQIFSLTIILTLAQSFISPVLNSRLTIIPKKMLYLWNIPGIIFIFSAFLLINYIGIMGIILSRLAATLTTTIIGLIIWNKIKKLEIK
ncbi:oligosaccharide flippase family protein [Patescibacteria group bacterium]|nr:oligosaccharide flippase family protein [Patescibacteria group bacterium]